MSSLSNKSEAITKVITNFVGSASSGPVDPTVDITQPGGPFPYGESILTDGAGSYTIAPTLRPYFVSFKIPTKVDIGGSVNCEHQGVIVSEAGFVVPFASNLIAVSVAVNRETRAGNTYDIEIVSNPTRTTVVVARLTLESGDRVDFRRDLSETLGAGIELGARIVQSLGSRASAFSTGIIVIELES